MTSLTARAAAAVAPLIAVASALASPSPALGAPASGSPQWRVAKPIVVAGTALADVVALPGGTAWAGGKTAGGKPLLYHLSSGHWRQARVAGLPGDGIVSVAGTSATNVWVTLHSGDAAAHLTRSGWHVTSFGLTQVSTVGTVVTTGPKDSWVFTTDHAADTGYAHHYNGSSWRTTRLAAVPTGTTGAASASSARNVWTWAYDRGTKRYQTLRFNGTRWREVSVPASLAPAGQVVLPQAILAISATNVWASAYTASLGAAGPIILLHWQGQGWRKVPGPLPAGGLIGPMSRDGAGGLWLGALSAGRVPQLLSYRAGVWRTYQAPSDSAGVVSPRAISIIPGTRSAWGVGVTGQTNVGGTTGAAILRLG